MHRVRMALPFFGGNGWEPLILKIDPAEQVGTRDRDLLATVPQDTRVWQAGCIAIRWTRWFGLHHVGLRSFFHLARLGSRIIESERPDVVFLSTTMFPLFVLGRYWKWKHGIPYVLDFQDPWVSDYRGGPGARRSTWKARVSRMMARLLEPLCALNAAHLVCVSPEYSRLLRQRYPQLSAERVSVLPFGAPEHDFALLASKNVTQAVFDRTDGRTHWVYTGRGGTDMAFALRGFFTALARARAKYPAKYGNLRVHFVGTDYAPAERARKTVEPIAIECAVADLVTEQTERIPYFEALKCLQDADALVVPGSDDPGYTASKIYPYVLAGKPLLAVFHEQSSVVEVLRSCGLGTVVTFNANDSPQGIAQRILEEWFEREPHSKPRVEYEAFVRYSAREMTRQLCAAFEAAGVRAS